MSGVYTRDPSALKKHASLYWPRELSTGSAGEVVSLLLQTQDKFLDVLSVADREPTSWKQVLQATRSLYPNLFLKHLVVLADVGGEIIKKITPLNENQIIPPGKRTMNFVWRENNYSYEFQHAHEERLSNARLHIDERVTKEKPLDGAIEDMVMILLFGGMSDLNLPEDIAQRCIIGTLLGDREAIERFVRPRYILVSRITGGAKANALGQAAQTYVLERLREKLGSSGWRFTPNGTIEGVSQTGDERDITFDIVAESPVGKYFAIEVSFQVTTNSTIERKSGQAQARFQQLHEKGCQIAYVIDGAGNFERASALETICRFSDCTVAFTESEIEVLVDFLRSNGGDVNGSLE